MNPLTKEIRIVLSSLNQFIKRMPENKIMKTQNSIKEILKVPNPESQESLNKVLKNLQYKYNFLKIAYPSLAIDNKPITETKEDVNECLNLQLKFDYNLYWNNMMDNETSENSKENNESTTENIKKSNTKDNNSINNRNENDATNKTNEDKEKSGTYVMVDGKLVKGEAKRRSLVDFSNWVAAHVDPEDLKKHRELLDRQHFRGPVWEGKKIPPSILDEKNPLFNTDVEPEINPNLAKPKPEAFETVKR